MQRFVSGYLKSGQKMSRRGTFIDQPSAIWSAYFGVPVIPLADSLFTFITPPIPLPNPIPPLTRHRLSPSNQLLKPNGQPVRSTTVIYHGTRIRAANLKAALLTQSDVYVRPDAYPVYDLPDHGLSAIHLSRYAITPIDDLTYLVTPTAAKQPWSY